MGCSDAFPGGKFFEDAKKEPSSCSSEEASYTACNTCCGAKSDSLRVNFFKQPRSEAAVNDFMKSLTRWKDGCLNSCVNKENPFEKNKQGTFIGSTVDKINYCKDHGLVTHGGNSETGKLQDKVSTCQTCCAAMKLEKLFTDAEFKSCNESCKTLDPKAPPTPAPAPTMTPSPVNTPTHSPASIQPTTANTPSNMPMVAPTVTAT